MSRDFCSQCHYILDRCLCHFITINKSPIPIYIVQEKKEARHALNTVKILKTSLQNLTVITIDDNLTSEELDLYLSPIAQYKNPILIFPSESAQHFENISSNKLKELDVIIFIDASWKKSKKIYFTSKMLKRLPAYLLNPTQKSHYQIRQSKFEKSLSTLEAVAYCLDNIYPKDNFLSLMIPFKAMIEKQIQKIDPKIYQANYQKKEGPKDPL